MTEIVVKEGPLAGRRVELAVELVIGREDGDRARPLLRLPLARSGTSVGRRSSTRPLGGGTARSAQILRARRKSISRWRGTALERSASKPQKLWLPPSRKSRAPWARR